MWLTKSSRAKEKDVVVDVAGRRNEDREGGKQLSCLKGMRVGKLRAPASLVYNQTLLDDGNSEG
jgi:hypothetical protein